MDRAVEDRAGQKGKYCDGGGSWFSTIFRADGSRNNSAHSASRSFDNKLKKLRESDHRSDRELIDEYDRLMDLEDLTDVVVVDELLAVINEIKGGSATRADIAGRGGPWPKYARSVDTDGVLRLNAKGKEIVLLRMAIERAYAKHGQLKQLLQEAQARPAAGLVQQGQPQSGSMPAVDDMVGHVRRWAGWIGEIKEGRTSPEGIASREGELWFALAFDEEGRLKPGNVSGCAGVVREMLGRLPPGCSDLIKVFEDSPLEGLIASGCEEAEGKKLDACEMLALTEEVRRGEITLVDAARAAKGAKGYSRIKRAFSHGGVFKAKGKDAGYILKKLDSNTANALIREAKAGTSRPLVRAAGALRNYTNWSRELMEGRITRPEIRRQEGGSPFCDAFDTHGKLDLTLDRNATRSALRRVDWAYEARPDLYDEFARTQGWKLKSEGGKLRELLDKGKEALADARPDLSEQSSVPRVPRINARRLGSQIVGLVQAILEIRAGSVALEDAERDFEGLSLLVDASGKFHDDKYLSGILETRLKPEQLNLGRKLIQDLRTLLPRADRFVGGASSAVGPGLDPAPETPSAHRVLRDFDLNEPWHEPQQADELVESSGVASVASRPVKPEMAEP
ncbi:MAG TPA: hypothetical protein VFP68_01520, partial [Burkholderiaceae bacterium]|nr:hypothetical protein [Burkholderiaceae bacterium]